MGLGSSRWMNSSYGKEAIELVTYSAQKPAVDPWYQRYRRSKNHRHKTPPSAKPGEPAKPRKPEELDMPTIYQLQPCLLPLASANRHAVDSTQNADTGRFCALDIYDEIKLQYEQHYKWEKLLGQLENGVQ